MYIPSGALERLEAPFIMCQFPGGFTSESVGLAGILKFLGGSGRLGSIDRIYRIFQDL
jgi:hypothetical protein